MYTAFTRAMPFCISGLSYGKLEPTQGQTCLSSAYRGDKQNPSPYHSLYRSQSKSKYEYIL